MGNMTLEKMALAIAEDFRNLKKDMNDRFDEVIQRVDTLKRYTREGFTDIRTNIENYRIEIIDIRGRLEKAEGEFGI